MSNYFKIAFFIYLAVVMFLATYPMQAPIATPSDKTNHALAFVLFSILFILSFRRAHPIFAFLFGLGYGVLIEIVQSFLPYRSAEMGDILADTVGLAVGILAMSTFEGILRKKTGSE